MTRPSQPTTVAPHDGSQPTRQQPQVRQMQEAMARVGGAITNVSNAGTRRSSIRMTCEIARTVAS
jgi:hypothetical protein